MLPAAKVSVAISFAIGLSVFALATPAVAQDAAKADTAGAAATKQSDESSDRHKSRAERRAEAAAKSEPLAQFPKADAATAASTEPSQPKPKMECRSQPVAGSHLGKRVCATPEQWAQADQAAAEAIRQMRSDASSKGGVVRPGGPYSVGGGP